MSSLEEFETSENLASHADPHFDMAVKPDAIGYAKRRRLADIVQQNPHRQRRRRSFDAVEHHQGVGPDVALGMKLGWLFDSFHRRDLRQDFSEQTARIEQFKAISCAAFQQNAKQLVPHTFGRDPANGRRQLTDGCKSQRLDSEAQARRKAHCPNEAQVVFLKAQFWIADGADHSIA